MENNETAQVDKLRGKIKSESMTVRVRMIRNDSHAPRELELRFEDDRLMLVGGTSRWEPFVGADVNDAKVPLDEAPFENSRPWARRTYAMRWK